MRVRLPHAWQWFGDRVDNEFERRIPVPSVVRIALALVIFLAGIAFLAFGIFSVIATVSSVKPVSQPVGAFLVALLTMAMGYGFSYVGWRLLRTRTGSDELLGRRARLVFAVFVAIAAAGEMWDGLRHASLDMICGALFSALWSWWMFYSVLSRRQAQRRALLKPPVVMKANR